MRVICNEHSTSHRFRENPTLPYAQRPGILSQLAQSQCLAGSNKATEASSQSEGRSYTSAEQPPGTEPSLPPPPCFEPRVAPNPGNPLNPVPYRHPTLPPGPALTPGLARDFAAQRADQQATEARWYAQARQDAQREQSAQAQQFVQTQQDPRPQQYSQYQPYAQAQAYAPPYQSAQLRQCAQAEQLPPGPQYDQAQGSNADHSRETNNFREPKSTRRRRDVPRTAPEQHRLEHQLMTDPTVQSGLRTLPFDASRPWFRPAPGWAPGTEDDYEYGVIDEDNRYKILSQAEAAEVPPELKQRKRRPKPDADRK